MGIHMQPMGPTSRGRKEEEVTCWKCDAKFEISRNVHRTQCPECGSSVAVHRLNLPAMPMGRRKDETKEVTPLEEPFIRMPEGRTSPSRPHELPRLQNGGQEERGDDWMNEAGLRLESVENVERRRRELFTEADPRMDGMWESPKIPGISWGTLIKSLLLAGALLFLVGIVLGQ